MCPIGWGNRFGIEHTKLADVLRGAHFGNDEPVIRLHSAYAWAVYKHYVSSGAVSLPNLEPCYWSFPPPQYRIPFPAGFVSDQFERWSLCGHVGSFLYPIPLPH